MKTIILVALITLGGFLFPSNDSTLHFRVAQYRADRQCAISYTFDDALEEHYTLVFPAFERLGFKGTFWVNGRTLSDTVFQGGKPRVTWAQLRRMSKKGHEISSHGWAHKNVTRLTPEELRYELQHNDTAIYNHIGVFPRTFCYPGNAKNDSVIAVVERTRIASRTEQFSVGGKSTDESLDKRVAELLANREWGVTMTHGITYGYDHFSDADVFWRHLRKVKAQDSLIWVAPFRTVAAYVKERKALAYEILPTK
ncbi:MAG: polysaccharide deacetylase family protein, partial [Tannerella sp.]|nr:polysaccharide deacetylase family protein [Tannerella sp.]